MRGKESRRGGGAVTAVVHSHTTVGRYSDGPHRGLPQTREGRDAILTSVGRLTEVALPPMRAVTAESFACLLLGEVIRLDGVPVGVVSDRDTRRTSGGIPPRSYPSSYIRPPPTISRPMDRLSDRYICYTFSSLGTAPQPMLVRRQSRLN